MHFHTPDSRIKLAPLDKFLKEMGLGEVESQDSLKVTQGNIPDESRVIVLSCLRT
jgi:hypothetical protein